MRQQTAIVLCATGVALLALTATPHGGAEAAQCLTGPKGPAPAGSHWFYRTDHATKRNCWYVRAAADKAGAPKATATADPAPTEADTATASSPANSPTASAESAAPIAAPKAAAKAPRSAAAPLHPSIANARAEFQSPPEPAPTRDAAEQDQASHFPAPLPTSDQGQAGDQLSATQGSPIEQRWAEAASNDPATSTDASAKLRTAAQIAVAKGATPATAALSSPGTASTLIVTMLAALALAGLIVGGIVKFSRRQPAVGRDTNRRRDIWASVPKRPVNDIAADHTDRSPDRAPPIQQLEPPAWIKAARQKQTAVVDSGQNHTDDIETLLARAQNRPAA